MDKNRGMWIAVEGPDGAGKSTLCKNLQLALSLRGPVEILPCPHPDCAFYNDIRHTLTQSGSENAEALQYYMIGNYREYLTKYAWPALAEGKTIISDRWNITSSIVYNLMDNGKLMEVLSNLSSVFFLEGQDSNYVRGDRYIDVDFINDIYIHGVEPTNQLVNTDLPKMPDLIFFLSPPHSILKQNQELRKSSGSKEINDIDLDRIHIVNKIYGALAVNGMLDIVLPGHNIKTEFLHRGTNFVQIGSAWETDETGKSIYYLSLFEKALCAIKAFLDLNGYFTSK